jgi:hypothetical protein
MVVEGIGSFGIVLSSPRIPLIDESTEDILNLNEVSKILINYSHQKKSYLPAEDDDIKKEYENIINLVSSNPEIFNQNNFLLPLSGGYINKNKFIKNYNESKYFNFEWLSCSTKFLNILNNLLSNKNKEIFQIIYPKGQKINLSSKNFIIMMSNVLNTLYIANRNGFYFDDLKLDNLLIHDNKIKIIDFAEPINLNNKIEKVKKQILESKLMSIFYFPYNIISNILIFEYIDKLNIIGKIENNDYHKLIFNNYLVFNNNIEYKKKIIYDFINLWEITLPYFKVKMNVLSGEIINDFDNDLDEIYSSMEIIEIDFKIFKKSIEIFLNYDLYYVSLYSNIYHNNKLITNNFVEIYKKFLEKTKKSNIEKLSYLLGKLNMNSFGTIFLQWLNKNLTKTKIETLKKIISVTCLSCLDTIIVENQFIFISMVNYSDILLNLDLSNIKYFYSENIL